MKLPVFCNHSSAQLLAAKNQCHHLWSKFLMPGVGVGAGRWKKGRHSLPQLHTNCPTFWLISFKFGEQTLIPIIQAWRLESWSRDLSILKSESLGLGLELLSLQSKPAVMVHTDTVDHSKDFSGYDLEVLNGAGTESFPESSVICDLV